MLSTQPVRTPVRLKPSAKRGSGNDARDHDTDREQTKFNGARAALIRQELRNKTAQISQDGVHEHALTDFARLRSHRERRHYVQPAARMRILQTEVCSGV